MEISEDISEEVNLKVIKNATSLQITIPIAWRELYQIEKGDWIRIKLIKILEKHDEEKKKKKMI